MWYSDHISKMRDTEAARPSRSSYRRPNTCRKVPAECGRNRQSVGSVDRRRRDSYSDQASTSTDSSGGCGYCDESEVCCVCNSYIRSAAVPPHATKRSRSRPKSGFDANFCYGDKGALRNGRKRDAWCQTEAHRGGSPSYYHFGYDKCRDVSEELSSGSSSCSRTEYEAIRRASYMSNNNLRSMSPDAAPFPYDYAPEHYECVKPKSAMSVEPVHGYKIGQYASNEDQASSCGSVIDVGTGAGQKTVTFDTNNGMKKRWTKFDLTKCRYCMTAELPSSHGLYNTEGDVVCPVLSKYQCPFCNATGPKAHTLKYCPQNPILRGDLNSIKRLPKGTAPDYHRLEAFRLKNPKHHCTFCKEKGFQSNHPFRDQDGGIACPVLYKQRCPLCFATGKLAHTFTYCPIYKDKMKGTLDPALNEIFEQRIAREKAGLQMMSESTDALASTAKLDSVLLECQQKFETNKGGELLSELLKIGTKAVHSTEPTLHHFHGRSGGHSNADVAVSILGFEVNTNKETGGSTVVLPPAVESAGVFSVVAIPPAAAAVAAVESAGVSSVVAVSPAAAAIAAVEYTGMSSVVAVPTAAVAALESAGMSPGVAVPPPVAVAAVETAGTSPIVAVPPPVAVAAVETAGTSPIVAVPPPVAVAAVETAGTSPIVAVPPPVAVETAGTSPIVAVPPPVAVAAVETASTSPIVAVPPPVAVAAVETAGTSPIVAVPPVAVAAVESAGGSSVPKFEER